MITPVSLIITVYNREQYLAAAIESILSQSYKDFELLIWDDGSTDDSVAIAQHYAAQDKRIQVIAAAHKGRAPALKAAIAATTGTYLGWVDSDDLLAETALDDTVTILGQHPEIGLVYTDYVVIDEHDAIKGYGNRCQIPYSKEKLLTEFMLFHFRLMHRSVYDQVGGIDEAFMYCQDYDLCLKLSEVTNVFHLQKPLYYYRHHKDSLSCERRIEQLLLGKQAIENALQRRGMTDEYELEFQVFSRATLLRKGGYSGSVCSKTEARLTNASTSPKQSLWSLPEDVNPQDFTNWALAPEALAWLANFIQTQKIKSVIELGSGLSTMLFAALQRDGLLKRSLSLEHDANWYNHTIAQLKQKGLLDYAQVQLCPLRQFALHEELVKWYDITAIAPFTADLILVDGPPSQSYPLAREPAPHLLQPFIGSGTWIVLDDYQRQAEQATVTRWLKALPHLKLMETVAIDTGLALLQFD